VDFKSSVVYAATKVGLKTVNNWRGLFVEPIPDRFEKLKQNYAGYSKSISFENSAISDKNGEAKFFYIPYKKIIEQGISYAELGTPNQLIHREHSEPVIVKTITMENLLKKHNVNRIDYLQIDAEGQDFVIFKQLDLDRYQPSLICIEMLKHNERVMADDLPELVAILNNKGYQHFHRNQNVWAWKNI